MDLGPTKFDVTGTIATPLLSVTVVLKNPGVRVATALIDTGVLGRGNPRLSRIVTMALALAVWSARRPLFGFTTNVDFAALGIPEMNAMGVVMVKLLN